MENVIVTVVAKGACLDLMSIITKNIAYKYLNDEATFIVTQIPYHNINLLISNLKRTCFTAKGLHRNKCSRYLSYSTFIACRKSARKSRPFTLVGIILWYFSRDFAIRLVSRPII